MPYKNVPTFTIGYKGLVQLAQRTGQYKIINADMVYEGELRGFDKLSGIPDVSGERISDTVVGYFAYFKLLNGHEHVYYMSKPDMEAYASHYSPSYNSNSSPWKKEFDKMAMKTVLRQLLSKWGPTSTEMQKVEALDDKGKTPMQEMQEKANKTMIDIQVDESTSEVMNPEGVAGARRIHAGRGTVRARVLIDLGQMPGIRQRRKQLRRRRRKKCSAA